MQNKSIFYHIGTERTGTTYLQKKIFPLFKKVTYISKFQLKNQKELIEKSVFQNIFISNEFGRNFEQNLKETIKNYPKLRPIIVFRKHSAYLVSQYKRYLKNGYKLKFEDFFHPHQESYFKNEEVQYKNLIQLIETHCHYPPTVFFYEDLIAQPKTFISRFANSVEASIQIPESLPNRIHTSYTENQLSWLLFFLEKFTPKSKLKFKNKSIIYAVLYFSKLLSSFNTKLIHQSQIKLIDDFFDQDWQYCKNYAQKNKK